MFHGTADPERGRFSRRPELNVGALRRRQPSAAGAEEEARDAAQGDVVAVSSSSAGLGYSSKRRSTQRPTLLLSSELCPLHRFKVMAAAASPLPPPFLLHWTLPIRLQMPRTRRFWKAHPLSPHLPPNASAFSASSTAFCRTYILRAVMKCLLPLDANFRRVPAV